MDDHNKADEPGVPPSGMRSASREWRWLWLLVPILMIIGVILWIAN